MKWIGLTGGIATGKSTVSKILRDLGLPVVDADHLAREVTKAGSEGLAQITKEFGREVLTDKGELDRAKLGQIIFSDTVQREKLEKILHPRIQELRAKERLQLEREGCALAFYDVPLLFEKFMQNEFDATILVYSKPDEQRTRLRERDKLGDSEIESRLKAQLPIDEKLKLANYVIMNNGNLSDLKLNVQSVISELKK